MKGEVISRLDELGVDLFRLNMSHTDIADLPEAIRFIQRHTRIPLCLDTEGAQVRTGKLKGDGIEVEDNTTLIVYSEALKGDGAGISLYPGYIVDQLAVGDLLDIDFNAVLAQVTETSLGKAALRVLNGGTIGQNKAVTIHKDLKIQAINDKDRAAIAIGLELGIRDFALSFVNRAEDVAEFRQLCGDNAEIISKIECRNGLLNLDEILNISDAILIDRGDLSREIEIEKIPSLQDKIIRRANVAKVPVYVATNMLESMVIAPGPTRAEVNDVYTTLASGADGLVLAAETAIGKYPVQCVSMVLKLIYAFRDREKDRLDRKLEPAKSMLIDPHGGSLVECMASPTDIANIDDHPHIEVQKTDLVECEQIAFGTYSPITAFMDQQTLESVLSSHRLPGGLAWTMPIVLQVGAESRSKFAVGCRVVLTGADGQQIAFLDISDVYSVDLDHVAEAWFGTRNDDHPGVKRMKSRGQWFVGGDVKLIDRVKADYRHYEMRPAQTRLVFSRKGWIKVVGFHTRNVAHRVHEHIQILALQKTFADGLYISPIIGPKKKDDFLPEPIFRSYELLVSSGIYPRGKVVLGGFSTYPRYCGPREAVFTALCRQNMGCSHFIVGRDHAGVGDYYGANANVALFEELGDIGIEPIFFDAIGFNPVTQNYEALANENVLEPISGTRARELLIARSELPEWFMRKPVQDMILAKLQANEPIFCE